MPFLAEAVLQLRGGGVIKVWSVDRELPLEWIINRVQRREEDNSNDSIPR